MSKVTNRPMRDDQDFWCMRALLVETASIAPIGLNWDMRRLEGKRFYNENVEENRLLARPVQLWETAEGRLVGFVLPEGRSDAHLNVHPDYRHLEGEMIGWAEAHLRRPMSDSDDMHLYIYANEYDLLRGRLLAERGFHRTEFWGMIRHMRLGAQPLAAPELHPDYTLRATQTDDLDDCQRIADLLNAAFGRTFHNAAEYQNFCRLSPSFRQDLDLVAVAPDGSFAAYAGVPYDETNRRGVFEPVCTHPEHQRKGLAKALMQEGLLRLRAVGAVDVTVDTGDMTPANRLYDSLGFTEAYKGFAWEKIF
ncbi:MAG: GNAT family N-acetyltransferase [Caldilineales bacterium]